MLFCTGALPERRSFLGPGLIWCDRLSVQLCLYGSWVPQSPVLWWLGVIWQCPEVKPRSAPSFWALRAKENPFRPKIWQLGLQCVPGADKAPGTDKSGFQGFIFKVTSQNYFAQGESGGFQNPALCLGTILGVRFQLYIVWGHWGQIHV